MNENGVLNYKNVCFPPWSESRSPSIWMTSEQASRTHQGATTPPSPFGCENQQQGRNSKRGCQQRQKRLESMRYGCTSV